MLATLVALVSFDFGLMYERRHFQSESVKSNVGEYYLDPQGSKEFHFKNPAHPDYTPDPNIILPTQPVAQMPNQ